MCWLTPGITASQFAKLLKSEIVGLYAILYSTRRIIMEFVRLDSPTVWGISIAQIVAAGLAGVIETGRVNAISFVFIANTAAAKDTA